MTYLTPAEAKEQTCPLIQYCVNPNAVIQDGQSAMHDHAACAGPDCKIGWRWERPDRPADTATFESLPLTTAAREWISSKLSASAPNPTVASLRQKLPSMREANWPDKIVEEIDAVINAIPTRGYCGLFGRPE